jgi:hypothetical protein
LSDTIKFKVEQLFSIGMVLVVTGIALAFGLEVMGTQRDDLGTDVCTDRTDGFTTYNATSKSCYNASYDHSVIGDAAFNATGDTILGVSKLPEKLPTIATVVVAAVIIGVLVNYLYVRIR